VQSFDVVAADYARMASLAPAPFSEWIKAQLPQHGRRALDAGCGPGNLAGLLAERFDQVTGIDISGPMIKIAQDQKSAPNIEYHVQDLMSFEDADGFDIVLSSGALHHLPNLEAALRHLEGLVRSGGRVILIDNIAWTTTPPRVIHILSAWRHFPIDVLAYGWQDARWMFNFRTSAKWLDHLASDRYLTRRDFRRRYGSVFNGARFSSLGYAEGLVWVAP